MLAAGVVGDADGVPSADADGETEEVADAVSDGVGDAEPPDGLGEPAGERVGLAVAEGEAEPVARAS